MQITVTIPDELAAEAEARGLALDRYIADLVAEDLAGSQQGRPKTVFSEVSGSATDEQHGAAVDEMLGFSAKHGFTMAGQDLKGMIHEGHPY